MATSKSSKPMRKTKRTAAENFRAMGEERALTRRRKGDEPAVASPAAAGPAGAVLEGHVGAQYLLPLLSGGEARGLPGVVVTRVAFQRAGLKHPMDDVIVTGHDRQGRPATLELQAKRTISFTASDKVFADVVALACRSASKPEFETERYELAVAIARTSTKIERHIQEVLKWAREYKDIESFFGRVNQPGAAHQGMRDFVAAFRGHMRASGAADTDAAVLRLLSRFQVLAFDFEQAGSACAQLARERCALQLVREDAGLAGALWDSLQLIALQVDAAGGDLDAAGLRMRLAGERGYRLVGDRRMHVAREQVAAIAESTLATIGTGVHGVSIDRGGRISAALSALEQGRYLEIRGAGGVGKSGVLKDLAERIGVESRVVVVAPHRVPSGGWSALAAQLGCDVSAREFLIDLAGDGGCTLFVDGIDRFDDPGQQATVADLIRAAAHVPGFSVVTTARLDFDADARAWLPTRELQDLGEAPSLVIDELDDDEMARLRHADPALAALLRPGHPAEKLVRNLYRLNRLARSVAADNAAPFSEAQMAWQWWKTGDSADSVGRLERCRVLRLLAVHLLGSAAPMDSGSSPASAITELLESGSLRALSSVLVEPAHDVLRDWAVGCLLYEEPAHFAPLVLEAPAPMRIVRGVEIAARLHAERGSDAMEWKTLLDRVSVSGAHGSWRRAVLLALTRTERADEALNRCLPALAANSAELLAVLIRTVITVDSQRAAPVWAALGFDTQKFSKDFVGPRGPAWLNLIAWSLTIEDRLLQAAAPQFVEIYGRWCSAYLGQDPLSPLLVARLYAWLVEVEAKNHPKGSGFNAWMAAQEAPGLSMTTTQENDLRRTFLQWCRLRPGDAESYLQGVAAHPHAHVLFRELLTFVGAAPSASPRALVDLFLQEFLEGDSEKRDRRSQRRDLFSAWDLQYMPASPARPPFLDLLQADKEQGLRLVHGVVAHAVKHRSGGREAGGNRIDVPFPGGGRSFPWYQSYMWSRSQDSYIVASALMALEAWAHLRIERGDPVQAVIDDVLGPEGSAAAYLLVAVDVMLSHWPRTREHLWPFAASATLLSVDRDRWAHDIGNINGLDSPWVDPEPAGAVRQADLRRRPSRRMPLDAVLSEYGLHGPADIREAMRHALREEAIRIGAPDGESRGMADPRFAAMSGVNKLDPENYVSRGPDKDGQPIFEYEPPVEEARLLAEFQNKVESGGRELGVRLQLLKALTERCCPPQLLEQGVRWAAGEASTLQTEADKDDEEWIERTRLIVATLVLRDGSRELKIAEGDWARAQLSEALMREPDRIGSMKQLPYNTSAIAAVGFLAAYRDSNERSDLQRLLQLAARSDTSMASVLRAEMAAQRPLRPELARALVRLGLVSAIYAVPGQDHGEFDSIDDYRARKTARETARKEAEQFRQQTAVEAELLWLTGGGPEPDWPLLPNPRPPKERRKIPLGKSRSGQKRTHVPRSAFELDAGAAAQWLSLAVELWRAARPDVLSALVRHCWPWTAGANGVGCGPDDEPGELAHEWNIAYFTAALAAGVSIGNGGIEEYVLDPITQLPDERFLDAAEAVLQELDQLWLNGGAVSDSASVSVREALAQRLEATSSWRRLASERSSRVEFHVAGAVAAMFMGQYDFGKRLRCYVLPQGFVRARVLLPKLTQMAEQAAGSTFVAIAFLGLMEVEPHAEQLVFMARAVAAWWRVQGANAEFWLDHGIGRRLCDWIDKAILNAPVSPEVRDSAELAAIVDILVQCGTPLARALEERLAAGR